VKFGYQSTVLSLEMLKTFRDMVNHAIRICLQEDIHGRFNLIHKATWSGVPTEFVSAVWTSQTCHACQRINGGRKLTKREWRCPNCGAILDRDLNAAINIERRGKIACLSEVRPGAQGTDEAVKGNPMTPVILRAEAPKVTSRGSFFGELPEP
jgi:hypothetical protein